jgi:hypothetical protein
MPTAIIFAAFNKGYDLLFMVVPPISSGVHWPACPVYQKFTAMDSSSTTAYCRGWSWSKTYRNLVAAFNQEANGHGQGQRAEICLIRESIIIMAPPRLDIVNQHIVSSLTKFDYCALAVMDTVDRIYFQW